MSRSCWTKKATSSKTKHLEGREECKRFRHIRFAGGTGRHQPRFPKCNTERDPKLCRPCAEDRSAWWNHALIRSSFQRVHAEQLECFARTHCSSLCAANSASAPTNHRRCQYHHGTPTRTMACRSLLTIVFANVMCREHIQCSNSGGHPQLRIFDVCLCLCSCLYVSECTHVSVCACA